MTAKHLKQPEWNPLKFSENPARPEAPPAVAGSGVQATPRIDSLDDDQHITPALNAPVPGMIM